MNERWVKIKKKYWPPRKDQLLILILVGLLLAVISVPVEDNREPEEVQVMDAAAETEQWEADYESRMEQRLEELLGNVEGVGQVRVMLTFQGTGEKIVEKDRSSGSEESREETVYEIADLCYHVMVLMVQMGITVEDITRELEKRHVVDHKVKQERMQ